MLAAALHVSLAGPGISCRQADVQSKASVLPPCCARIPVPAVCHTLFPTPLAAVGAAWPAGAALSLPPCACGLQAPPSHCLPVPAARR